MRNKQYITVKLHKYNQFLNLTSINEDMKQAKAFLRRHIVPENGDTATIDEIEKAEKNPDFLEICKLLEKNPGYIYTFTKFHFADGVPITAPKNDKNSTGNLTSCFNRMMGLKNSKRIKQIQEYAKVTAHQ